MFLLLLLLLLFRAAVFGAVLSPSVFLAAFPAFHDDTAPPLFISLHTLPDSAVVAAFGVTGHSVLGVRACFYFSLPFTVGALSVAAATIGITVVAFDIVAIVAGRKEVVASWRGTL